MPTSKRKPTTKRQVALYNARAFNAMQPCTINANKAYNGITGYPCTLDGSITLSYPDCKYIVNITLGGGLLTKSKKIKTASGTSVKKLTSFAKNLGKQHYK